MNMDKDLLDVVDNPTPEMVNIMVKNAVKCIKKPNGASAEDICKYIESKYDMKLLRSRVDEALNKSVDNGTFQKVNEQYVIQEALSGRRDFRNMYKNCPDPEFKDAASLENICEYIEDNYGAKVSKNCVRKVLDEGERVRTFEKINEHYFAEKGTFSRKDNEDDDIDFSDLKLNVACTSKSINPQSKAVVIRPTPGKVNTMVKTAVKHLKRPNGASLEEVFKYIEDNYEVKVSKNCVHGALREEVNVGTFEKINGEYFLEKGNSRRKIFVEERFKMSEEKPGGFEKEPEIQTLTREMVAMMVKYSIKNMKKANGASLMDIRSYMEEHYRINMKFSLLSVSHILNNMVSRGLLVKITGADKIERFKFKEEERRK